MIRGQVILSQEQYKGVRNGEMMLNAKDDYFEYVRSNPDCKIVVYGAGQEARNHIGDIGHIDYFCDQCAESFRMVQNIPCILPENLLAFREKLIILICVRKIETVEEICAALEKMQIDAEVFNFFDNPSFAGMDVIENSEMRWEWFNKSVYSYVLTPKDQLRICIVYREDGWILGKFARKLQEELLKLEQEVTIAPKEDPRADVNHYVYFETLSRIDKWVGTVRTTMVTHVNCQQMKERIQYQARNNVVGICMSKETCNNLCAWGISRDKLCYVNPAHDGDIKPRKIVLGITNRCYTYDLRKRDNLILQVCRQLDASLFKLKIMGSGWNEIVMQLQILGFEIDYYAEFDGEVYKELIASLDYWIFSGFDEGGMGYLDALAAGVKTIATPQGFHLDTKCGLTYPCSTIDDFICVLKQIQEEKKEIMNAVKDWTWRNYARKHLEIWQYLTRTKSLKNIYSHQNEYMDGIFSLMVCDIMG